MAEVDDSTTAAAPSAGFAPVIEMLRGVAAFAVLIFHARVALWVGWREIHAHPEQYSALDRALAWLSAPTPFLGAGVMLFFVISGFCVHQPVAGATAQPRWRAYFLRRLLRVYPPYLAAIGVSVATAAVLGIDTGHVGASAFMMQNYTGAASETALASQIATNPSLWSLPVEMEFYLIYPLLWLGIARAGWSAALGGVALVTLAAVGAQLAGVRVLDGNFALYWLVWCGGAWLREQQNAGRLTRPSLAWDGAAVILLALGILFTLRPVAALAQLCWGGVSFWLVWRGLTAKSLAPDSWLARTLRATGRWSYSLYLLHFPLLLLLGAAWSSTFGAKPANFAVALAGCVVVIGPVIAFHVLIEQSSHRWARKAGA